MQKYDEIMDKIHVTDEMKKRILSNIENEAEKGKVPGKRRILPFKTLHKIMAAAACLLLLGVSAAVIKPSLVKDPSKIPVEVPTETGENVQGTFRVEEKNSAEELSDTVGFTVKKLASLEEKATVEYVAYGTDLAEINYTWGEQTICLRQSEGTEDNSGDFNTYNNETIIQTGDYKVTAKGNKSDEFSVFLWTDGTYAYSIHAEKPLKNADICAFVYEIEKN